MSSTAPPGAPPRPHQQAAIEAIRQAALRGERRMTVVSACGTGKTITAAHAAQHLTPDGKALVLVPTLALVTQTIAHWHRTGRPGPVLGVCSLPQTRSGPARDRAVMTADPRTVADTLAGPGPATVVATYDSLDTIHCAHRWHALAPWDLLVADEAHRTCSAFGEGWGTVHDDAAIPAKTRIYMTATPRIWNTRPPTGLAALTERTPTATMDREDIFGPTVFRLGLADAIGQGILADYQVAMPVVGDTDLRSILQARRPSTSAHHNGLRTTALQIAVLHAIAEHDLKRVLVFHNRVAAAHAFARTLPRTAAQVAPQLRTTNLWARAVDGTQSPGHRRELLTEFGDPATGPAVLSNVRVLNEGVDMPAVDAVVFADPRGSVIDAIQAIGRGLRQTPGSGKVATLVIPVYLPDGAAGDLEGSAYKPLWTILQALRAHDDTYLDRIALPRRHPRAHSAAPARRPVHSPPERAAHLAHALGLEVTLPATGTWDTALAAASHYADTHGHLDVPAQYIDDNGFALGEWITHQRLRRATGRIDPAHIRVLDDLGMHWNAPTVTFEHTLVHARAYAAHHGHLAAPADATVGGHRIGAWLAAQRAKARTGTLPQAHDEALRAIDRCWNAPRPAWHRMYARARAHASTGASLDLPNNHTTDDGIRLGRWLNHQRNHFDELHPGEAELLIALGVTPNVDHLYPGPYLDPARRDFRRGLIAAANFLGREHHLDVPHAHTETDWIGDFPLGTWTAAQRRAERRLTDEQRAALQTLGINRRRS